MTDENPEQTQPAQQPSPTRMYDTLIQEERMKNFMGQTSPTLQMKNIDYILRGYMYSEEERKYVKVSDGIPNEIRLDFLQMLTPHLSEDVRMTNLSANQINNMMAFIIEWVTDYLDNVADKHNLDETQLTKIGLICLSAVYYTILRSQDGMESRRIFGSLKMGENLTPFPQGKGEKDWWKIWKKR